MLTCIFNQNPEKLWLQDLFLACDRVVGNPAKSSPAMPTLLRLKCNRVVGNPAETICLPYGDKINSLDYSLSTFLP